MKKHFATDVVSVLKNLADPVRAANCAWFFKTGTGEYGYGDKFLGIIVPLQRAVAREFRQLPLAEVEKLLKNKFHECRFAALEILVMQYENGNDPKKKQIYKFYLAHTAGINNWDLVDTSASYIVGDYLLARKVERKILYKLVKSKNLWERRIAIIATQKFIAEGQYDDTLKLAELLLTDTHDLLHKAVGWMLREVGKRSKVTLEKSLKAHAKRMPRTMLRYAIEKFPPKERERWLNITGSI